MNKPKVKWLGIVGIISILVLISMGLAFLLLPNTSPTAQLSNLGNQITQSKDGSASVYEVKNTTVSTVASTLVKDARLHKQTNQFTVSKEVNHQILLWDNRDNELVNLRQKGNNVIAEVDQKGFAKKHYSTPFLMLYYNHQTIFSMFHGDPTGHGSYKGYSGKDSSGVKFETPEEFHASTMSHTSTDDAHPVTVDAAR